MLSVIFLSRTASYEHQFAHPSPYAFSDLSLSSEREVPARAWERVCVSFGDVTKFRAKSISGKGTPGY